MRSKRGVVVVVVVIAAALAVVVPVVRDAIKTQRTGVAPGSFVVSRIAPVGAGAALVAVGAEMDGDTGRAGAWRYDGEGWTGLRAPDGATHLADVAVARGRIVAVGAAQAVPTIWTRPLGGSARAPWETSYAATIDPGLPDSFGEFSSVAVAGDGAIVAVGFLLADGRRSPIVAALGPLDGSRSWRAGAVDTPAATMNAVTVAGAAFVAAGAKDDHDAARPVTSAAFWRSDDGGGTWREQPVETPAGAPPRGGSFATAVAAGADGVAVVGVGSSGGLPVAWAFDPSAGEGAGAWRRAGEPSVGPGQHLRAVVPTGDGGFLVVGREIVDADSSRPLAWFTPDRERWTVVGAAGAAYDGLADAVVGRGSAIVAVGNDEAGRRVSPMVFDLRGSVLVERG
ncbi:MAG TPA: hypothetical protein VF230_03785 [Acidimicrobiales bacterium]